MDFTKENIFVVLITILVVSGGVYIRLSDKKYKTGKDDSSSIAKVSPVIGKGMTIRGVSCGSAVATEGAMMYLLVNDSCTIQYDFKSKIKSVSFNDYGVEVAVSDTIYNIPYEANNAVPNKFATSVPPIPVASLSLFSQSVTAAE